MRRLDGLSAFLLAAEKPGAFQHTLKIGIYDPTGAESVWTYQRFRDDLERHLSLAPALRWKLQRVPFNLHRPLWVDDPGFDIDYHLRHVVCPAPGDSRALCALISQLYAWPLDFSKPLWLQWFTEGLPGGQVAVITLLHHAYMDGTGASRAMEQFLTTRPGISALPADPASTAPWQPEPTPGQLQLVLSALRDIPAMLAGGMPRLVRGIGELRRLQRQYEEARRELPPDPFRDSRDSPFNIRLSHGRTFVFETFPFERIKGIAQRLDVTVNDLLLATASTVYRDFMRQRGFDPDKGPLIATIPVQRRPPRDQDDFIGNQTTADYTCLPVHVADPMERLRVTKHWCDVMKEHIKASAGADTLSLLEIIPPVVLRVREWFLRRSNRQGIGLEGNVVMSNVVGPREPLYWGQIRLANWISMGQVTQGMGINVTVWTYAGNFNLSILADRKLLPDGWVMIERFREAFAEYERLADQDRTAA